MKIIVFLSICIVSVLSLDNSNIVGQSYLDGFMYEYVSNPYHGSPLCVTGDIECPEYTNESAIVSEYDKFKENPDLVIKTCAKRIKKSDVIYCPGGEYCVVPFPGFTPVALNYAKCRSAVHEGEICCGEIQYKEKGSLALYSRFDYEFYIFPPCDEGLICEREYYSSAFGGKIGICKPGLKEEKPSSYSS